MHGSLPPRPLALALATGLLSLSACEPARRSGPESLDVFATEPGAPTWASARRSFGVGVQSELRVAGDLGELRTLRAVRCPPDECAVAVAPSEGDPSQSLFLVTPRVSDFHVSIDFVPFSEDTTSTVDRGVHAEDGELVAMHRGAGPGVPFVEGMHVVWYLGTRAPGVAWTPTAARTQVRVTPPFQLAGEPKSAEGPDQDRFLRVEIAAPTGLVGVARGSAVVVDGPTTRSFPLVAVPRRAIAKLLVAPSPEAWPDRRAELPDVARLATDRVQVPSFGVARAWLAFETTDGLRGIAGAGECLPTVDATAYALVPYRPAYYGFELDVDAVAPTDQPYLELEGRGVGRSRLRLALGELETEVDVIVGGGGDR